MSENGANATYSVFADDVCFRAAAKLISMADMRWWVQSFVATPLIWDDEEVWDDVRLAAAAVELQFQRIDAAAIDHHQVG